MRCLLKYDFSVCTRPLSGAAVMSNCTSVFIFVFIISSEFSDVGLANAIRSLPASLPRKGKQGRRK